MANANSFWGFKLVTRAAARRCPGTRKKAEDFINSCYTCYCISCLLITSLCSCLEWFAVASRPQTALRSVCVEQFLLSQTQSHVTVNHVTVFAKTMPPFSAGQSDESEISNLKICIQVVIELPRFFPSVVNPSLTS